MTADVLEEHFVLPGDATLVSVRELSPRVRSTLGALDDGEAFAISRERFRVPARLITPELAQLMNEFRSPSRIVDAVLRFSRAQERDPLATLEDAFDALALFINSSVLVTAGSPGADDRPVTLGPGQVVGAYEVEQLVSALVDTEVYRVRDQAGVALALKLARPEIPDDFLDGEARVLQSLGGGRSPALVEHGHFQGRPFLALEWRPGVPVTVAAQRARADRRRLHAVCLGVLDAYAWLHERDVVHGDVHPGNVLVADDGAVTVLDFGRGPDAPRAGIPQFHEPELAAAVLDARTLPPPTPAGEQFAVGALLYQLIAGVDQLEFSPEREVLLTQLVSQPPLPFAARGVASWPAVEAVLATALAKRPDERFASLAAFRDAFARADVPPQRRRQPRAAARRLVAEALAATPSDRAEALDLGWFTLRAAQVRSDPALLARADVWGTRAQAPALEALIHRARSDNAAQGRAAQALLAACERSSGIEGRCRAMVAAAEVVASSDTPMPPLREWLRATVSELWRTLDTWEGIDSCRELAHLGLSHGWAGVLYATLRACRAAALPAPGGLDARLAELAALAQHDLGGACWRGTLGEPGTGARTPDLAPGWCSGSAGHVLLWSLADGYQELARLAARYVIDHPARDPDLCCGLTGRGFALLRMHKVTGEAEWLDAARRLADEAAGAWGHVSCGSLRRGPLGTALLLIELEEPEGLELPLPVLS